MTFISDAQALERRLSAIINTVYGLTPEDIALLWASCQWGQSDTEWVDGNVCNEAPPPIMPHD